MSTAMYLTDGQHPNTFLGQFSAGWRFVAPAHFRSWEIFAGMLNYGCYRKGTRIVDEYGVDVSLHDFINTIYERAPTHSNPEARADGPIDLLDRNFS